MRPRNTETKAIAPKILAESSEWYAKMFSTLNAGATFVLDSFPNFYAQTLSEMRGMFTQGELCMILDVLNGHGTILLTYGSAPGPAGHHITVSIADSFDLYPGMYQEKWDIKDKDDFINRINNLPRFFKVCLEVWAAGFWENHESTTPEEWSAPLL